jgi:hypothetical protein
MQKASRIHNSNSLQAISLLDLARLITADSCLAALEEFLLRPLFRTREEPRLRLHEYLEVLQIWASGRTWPHSKAFETADKAYDLTMDKFTNLPSASESSEQSLPSVGRKLKRPGPDCRYYWRAFLHHTEQEFANKPPGIKLEEETKAATILQRFVRRHFLLSLLEAKRSTNEFWSRYTWRIGDYSICVWLPKFLKGKDRRAWLEENIKDPEPTRLDERERIQRIIGGRFANMAFVPLQDSLHEDPAYTVIGESLDRSQFGFSLARFVADEKSADIENQRRSIKNLGAEKLKQLVLRIFEDLDAGSFQDHRIAEDFELSKSTFSRFAGSQWRASDTDYIPDLWLNTAQVLSTRPEFKEAAVEAGVWGEVEKALKKDSRN